MSTNLNSTAPSSDSGMLGIANGHFAVYVVLGIDYGNASHTLYLDVKDLDAETINVRNMKLRAENFYDKNGELIESVKEFTSRSVSQIHGEEIYKSDGGQLTGTWIFPDGYHVKLIDLFIPIKSIDYSFRYKTINHHIVIISYEIPCLLAKITHSKADKTIIMEELQKFKFE